MYYKVIANIDHLSILAKKNITSETLAFETLLSYFTEVMLST